MSALWAKDDADDAAKRRRLVLGVLEDIRDQRAKLKLEFEEGLTSLKDITASLLDYGPSGVTVEVTSLRGASGTWIGAALACHFRIQDRAARGREQFLTFKTKVLGVEQRPSGFLHLLLAFPESVGSAQQRRSVRVNVDARRVPELSLWNEISGKVDFGRRQPLFGPEEQRQGRFKVDNFSANGLRLLVSNALMHETLVHAARGQRYTVFFRAVEEPGTPPASFWVNAVLRNVFHDPQKGETALGFEFTAQGRMDPDEGLVFKTLQFDEVTGLGKFVFKWNLDLYRSKGLGTG